MTYVYKPNTYQLKFGADSGFDGLEVTATSVPLGSFIKLMGLASAAGNKADEKSAEALGDLFQAFGSALLAWNLTDELGTPTPPTADSLNAMPVEFGMALVEEWMTAIGGVKTELGKGSGSGVNYPEVPIPMGV